MLIDLSIDYLQGIAVLNFESEQSALKAIEVINEIQIGKNKLRGIIINNQVNIQQKKTNSLNAEKMFFLNKDLNNLQNLLKRQFRIHPISEVICLKDILREKDYYIQEEFQEALESIKEQLQLYGNVIDIKTDIDNKDWINKSIFVQYQDKFQSQLARSRIQELLFDGRGIEVYFYDKNLFDKSILSLDFYIN